MPVGDPTGIGSCYINLTYIYTLFLSEQIQALIMVNTINSDILSAQHITNHVHSQLVISSIIKK